MFDPATTYVITGLPRSGTTYLAALLHRPPRMLTIADPRGAWLRHFARHGADAGAAIAAMAAWRTRVLAGEVVPAFPEDGTSDAPVRVDTWRMRKVDRAFEVTDDVLLGLKNPEVFLAMLPGLVGAGLRVLLCVRDPVEVIASWARRAGPGTFGDGACAWYTSRAATAALRRVDLYARMAERVVEVAGSAQVRRVRYERWFTDGQAQLREVTDLLGAPPLDALRPPPVAPEPVTLDAGEVDLVRKTCRVL